MLFDAWYLLLLRGIPEAIAAVALATAILNIKLKLSQLIVTSSAIGTLLVIFLQIPLQRGIHILLGIVIFIIILSYFCKIHLIKSAGAAIFSFVIISVFEILMVIVQIIRLEPKALFTSSGNFMILLEHHKELIDQSSDLFKLLVSLPPLILLSLLAIGMQFFIRRKHRSDRQRVS